MESAPKTEPAHGGAGVTQLVECDLAKVDVAGSNPVSRSISNPNRVCSPCYLVARASSPQPWLQPRNTSKQWILMVWRGLLARSRGFSRGIQANSGFLWCGASF